jgi:hypothetical protein
LKCNRSHIYGLNSDLGIQKAIGVGPLMGPRTATVAKCPIAMVDAIIETLTGGDPSPPTAPPTLSNPIQTTDTVAKDGINIQPRVEVVHNVEQNVSLGNMVSKPAGTL